MNADPEQKSVDGGTLQSHVDRRLIHSGTTWKTERLSEDTGTRECWLAEPRTSSVSPASLWDSWIHRWIAATFDSQLALAKNSAQPSINRRRRSNRSERA